MPPKTQRKKTPSPPKPSPRTVSMRNFLTRTDKAKSPPTKMVDLWANAYGLSPRLSPEIEGRYRFEHPSSSERRIINEKYEKRAKIARAKLGVNKNLWPDEFKMGGRMGGRMGGTRKMRRKKCH